MRTPGEQTPPNREVLCFPGGTSEVDVNPIAFRSLEELVLIVILALLLIFGQQPRATHAIMVRAGAMGEG